jgi:hypothetical protein
MIKLALILTLVLSYTLCVGQHLLPISYNEFLPIENTTGCYQDHQGYFWFYSLGCGLVCFNGVETQLYSPTQPKPYRVVSPNTSVNRRSTYEEENGDIWRIFYRYSKTKKGLSSHFTFFRDQKILIDIIFDGADHFIHNMQYPSFVNYKNQALYQICPITAIQSLDTTHINDTLVIECIHKNNDPTNPYQNYFAVNNNLLLLCSRDEDQQLTTINWLNIKKKTSKPALEFQQWLGTDSHFATSNNNDSIWYIRQQQTANFHYIYHYNSYNQWFGAFLLKIQKKGQKS